MKIVHVVLDRRSIVFLANQVAPFAARGIELVFVTGDATGSQGIVDDDHLPITVVPMTKRITPAADLRSIVGIARILRAVGATAVEGHMAKSGLMAMIAGLVARTPVRIYRMRGAPFADATGLRRRLLFLLECLSSVTATHVLVESPSLRAYAQAEGVWGADRWIVLGPGGIGVDTAAFNPVVRAALRDRYRAQLGVGPDELVFGWVGRLHAHKGADELVAAWQQFRAAHPDRAARLVVIGEPEAHAPPLPATIAALRTVDGITWQDRTVSRADFIGFLSSFDVLVFPSRREGLPNTPLEAGALGLPVIGVKAVGTIDVIRHLHNGYLADVQSPPSLADALAYYSGDRDAITRHGAAAAALIAARFRAELLDEELARFYRAAVG